MKITKQLQRLGTRLLLAIFTATLVCSVLGTTPVAAADPAKTATWTDGSHIKYNDGIFDTTYSESKIVGTTMTLTRTTKPGGLDFGGRIEVVDYPIATTAKYIGRVCSTRGGGCTDKTPVPITLTNNETCASTNTCTDTNPTTNPTGTGDDCPISPDDHLRWILCPLFVTGKTAASGINAIVANMLYVKTDQIFGTAATQGGGISNLQNAYNTFRNIGLGLLVIAGLVMVFSQSIGLEIFSAYTIRKALPRIVIAAIGMSLAWPILQFVIILSNDLGTWISQIILSAANVSTGSSANLEDAVVGIGGSILTLLGAFLFFGGGWLLSILGTILLAALVAMLTLAIRQLVILLCILLAPIAIASSVLPGTDRLWKFWRDTLIGALVMFPIIMGFLSSGLAMASIAAAAGSAADAAGDTGSHVSWDLLAILVCFAPYFFIPFSFRLASGLMGNIFGLVSDRSKGAFERLSKFRQNESQLRHQERLQGKRGVFGNSELGLRAYQRIATRGGIGLTRASWARGGALVNKNVQLAQEETLKNDGGFAAADDQANELAAQRGMTRERFLAAYADRAEGERSLARIEASYGTPLGSSAMRVAAYKAATRSTTSYMNAAAGGAGDTAADMDNGLARLRRDAGDLVADGLMSAEDATSAIKFNQTAMARKDRSGISYGLLRNQIRAASTGAAATAADITDMRESAWGGSKPGEIITGRPETVRAFAPHAERLLNDALASGVQQAVDEQLANIDAIYNVMKSTNPDNAEVWAREVMGAKVHGLSGGGWAAGNGYGAADQVTIRQAIERARVRSEGPEGEQTFLDRSREYSNRYARDAAEAGQAAGAPPPPPP